jgi:broad specificity phosphatase PhoE
MKLRFVVVLAALAVTFLAAAAPPVAVAPTTIVIVRHAEKAATGGADPHLSDAGLARAKRLADTLASSGLDVAYVTQFLRTKETADPAASRFHASVVEVPVEGGNVAAYVAKLAALIRDDAPGKTILIVSHSNTVPAIVKALANVDAAPMGDAEYDRIYIVTLAPGGAAKVIVAQYACGGA